MPRAGYSCIPPPPTADALPPPTHTPPRTHTRAQRWPNRAADVRRILTLSVVEGGLVQVFLNWTTGSVIIGYMLHLGAYSTEIGLIASVPMLVQLAWRFLRPVHETRAWRTRDVLRTLRFGLRGSGFPWR